ncbi:MAG: LysM peptidoglycan-binding domain-containing protein [Planctomycetes bacterium]|nr:LysM peptidoglycan-binding domain-containing protein [Planctomycetota bacterium]
MDRGVKIAIFVASIASLGLGLIWDQVLSHARVMVEESSQDELAAEVISAEMGPPGIDRLQPVDDLDPGFQVKTVDNPPDATESAGSTEEASAPQGEWTEYTVQNGDSWWKLAHVTFKSRGLSSEDIERANKGKVLRPGDKLLIPPGKEAIKAGPPAKSDPAPSGEPGKETEYIVQDGDSWWVIANRKFKDRGLSSDDIANANPGVKLVAGAKVKIPGGK